MIDSASYHCYAFASGPVLMDSLPLSLDPDRNDDHYQDDHDYDDDDDDDQDDDDHVYDDQDGFLTFVAGP